jgi:hypothetical protein
VSRFASLFYNQSATQSWHSLGNRPPAHEKRAGADTPTQGVASSKEQQPMHTDTTKTVQSFGLLDSHRSECSVDTHIRSVYVLESIETGDELRNRRTLILCPNCAREVDRYEEGLPPYLSWFKASCPDCQVELKRWSVAAVAAESAENIEPKDLSRLVQTYWNRNLWNGIKTAEDCPRTREFSDEYSSQAEEFGWSWEPTCPLCRRATGELKIRCLDYHHWRKDPDQGICLCRDCHDYLNGGSSDTEVDWKARKLVLKNKHDLQIVRLAVREYQQKPITSIDEFSLRLVRRFNLIQSPETVRAILRQAAKSNEIGALLEDNLPFVE